MQNFGYRQLHGTAYFLYKEHIVLLLDMAEVKMFRVSLYLIPDSS